MYEAIGVLASVIVLLSFVMNGESKIRIINIIGALLFVVYGVLINAFSVWFLNGTLLIVHIYKLVKLKRQ
jgi:hypothetical protein